MHSLLTSRLDTQAAWRASLDRAVAMLERFLAEHDLDEPADTTRLAALRQRLQAERLTVAFVAEFSRGKSELINAIFFADTGGRVLPATPGRTTMCPVELRHDAGEPPSLALLPIESRLGGASLTDLRGRPSAWQRVPLDPTQPAALAQALTAVTHTQRVSIDVAERLGFWHAEQPDDNPPVEDDGRVDVPAWRHALINYPHPLLERGLVVLDTPGLNAIGAEPELTLSLLPAAHATVFVLGADTGVTKSDLEIWREHLGGAARERFVVLNKIDALADPLLSAAAVHAQIERQCRGVATTLDLPLARVFPVSARTALAARIDGDAQRLQDSRLPALETALAAELLPRQAELLRQALEQTLRGVRDAGARRLSDQRRQNAEQMLELRGLRGKSNAKVRLMLQRVEAEAAEFERCTMRLAALRAVQARQLREGLARLSSEGLRAEVAALQSHPGAAGVSLAALASRKGFTQLFERLRRRLDAAEAQGAEIRQMLEASFGTLNAEYGFAFVVNAAPELDRYRDELTLIDHSYGRYIGLAQAWRLALPGFAEQFRRMLLAKLRVVFENAAGEIELWSKGAGEQIELQLRERRKAFQRRREALERIQLAAGELEQRIAEIEAREERLRLLQTRLDRQVEDALRVGRRPAPDAARSEPAAPPARRTAAA
ncbi:MAG: dynamin family protein [Rubrivivax sp.]